MSNPHESQCKLCQVGVGMEEGRTHVAVADEYGVSEASVRRHRNYLRAANEVDEAPVPQGAVPSADHVLAPYGLSHANMRVRGATVRDEVTGSWVRLVAKEEDEAQELLEQFDGLEILNSFKRPEVYDRGTGESAFVVNINDWQAGKEEGGGTPALIKRVQKSVGNAIVRINELRMIGRDLGTLVIIGGGDIIEGCSIYPNQSYSIDRNLSDQIFEAYRLILWVIDQLAPMFEDVIVLATKGNHGENRIKGQKTTPRDNYDTMIFRQVQVATERDERLSHVRYVICEPDMEYVYTEVCGWVLGTTHGDVFGKFVPGQTKMLKAWEWWKRMATGRQRIHMDVLVTHHFHHEEKADWGGALWVQTRAQDGGSAYFEQFSGQYSEPGMLSFVMTPDNRYQDEAYL